MNSKDLTIRLAKDEDVVTIAEIEAECFSPAEAASLASFLERFQAFPECFIVAEKNGKLVGHMNGCATDKPDLPDALYHDATLHQPDGSWQTVFGLAVLPEYQHQGIARALMREFQKMARERGKKGVILTCKEAKIGFYESLDFECQGVSESTHGGARWNDMILRFS